MDQGFPSLRLHHWRISWTRRSDGSHWGPIPFSLDVTVIGRDWQIKSTIRRRPSRWWIWIQRCRRFASRCWPTFLGSSRRAQQAALKLPHAGIPPWTRGRAAAKGRHGLIGVPRRPRRLHLPRRHRRQLTTTKTAWGPRRVPASWRSSSVRTTASRASSTTDRTACATVTRPGPVISIVFSFGYGIHKSLNSSMCAGHLSVHVYQYKIYLENTGTNQFRS